MSRASLCYVCLSSPSARFSLSFSFQLSSPYCHHCHCARLQMACPVARPRRFATTRESAAFAFLSTGILHNPVLFIASARAWLASSLTPSLRYYTRICRPKETLRAPVRFIDAPKTNVRHPHLLSSKKPSITISLPLPACSLTPSARSIHRSTAFVILLAPQLPSCNFLRTPLLPCF